MRITAPSRRPVSDKRAALLRAALKLFARDGLHSVPTSAISRAAGVATGTLFLYFKSKEELVSCLYLEAITDLAEAMTAGENENQPSGEFRRVWLNRARWHLANPDASRFIRQCEASAVLSPETRAAKTEIERAASERFDARLASGALRPWPRQVHFALLEGPILVLAHLRDKGEIEITDELLEMTFEGVSRAMTIDP